MLPNFEILTPLTTVEASKLMTKYGDDAIIYAGGTDILVMMREGKLQARYLIDIKHIESLKEMQILSNGGVKIGTCCTFNEIIQNQYIHDHYPQFLDGMCKIGSLQIRHLATIGGNVCNAIPSADSVPALLVSDAVVEIENENGKRKVPLCKFYINHRRTVLKKGELVTAFVIPPMRLGQGATYIKYTRRKAMDIALFGVAAFLEIENGRCVVARVAVASASPTPTRVKEAEDFLVGHELTEDVIIRAGKVTADSINPRSSVRSSSEYRKRLARVLTPRVIRQSLDRANGLRR